MVRVFDAFREAGEFAANYCRTNRCTAKVYRKGSGWAVEIDAPTPTADPIPPQTEGFAAQTLEDQSSDELEGSTPDLSFKREELLNLAKRGSLTHLQLSLVIDNAQAYLFSEEDLFQLRNILKKMPPPSGDSPAVCPSCHMVGSNCTCGRSWF